MECSSNIRHVTFDESEGENRKDQNVEASIWYFTLPTNPFSGSFVFVVVFEHPQISRNPTCASRMARGKGKVLPKSFDFYRCNSILLPSQVKEWRGEYHRMRER